MSVRERHHILSYIMPSQYVMPRQVIRQTLLLKNIA